MSIDNFSIIKCEIKKDLIAYFDFVKSEIDISAFKMLHNPELNLHFSQINQLYKSFIEIVDNIYENNAKAVDAWFDISNKETFLNYSHKDEVKNKILTGFCHYIPLDSLKAQLRGENYLGLLIVTDYFLNQNHFNYLKAVFEENSSLKFDYNEDILLMKNEIEISGNIPRIKNFKDYVILKKQKMVDSLLKKSNLSIDFSKERELLNRIENATFKNYKHIKIIDLYYVESIENEVFSDFDQLENLFILRTDENENQDHLGRRIKIKSNVDILKIVKDLKNLSSLSLHGWAIDTITPNYFLSFSKLTELYLTDNVLGVISEDFFKGLDNLELLNLEDNDITEILPFTFFSLKKLKDLTISNNQISNLSTNTFNGLENLKFLYICANSIKNIEKDSFKDLKNLHSLFLDSNEVLSLQNCQIEDLQSISFSMLVNLKRLDLSYNRIGVLKSEIFQQLSNLDYLNLSSCGIKVIEENSFYNLKKLISLDISDNELKDINQIKLEDFKIQHGLDSLINFYFHSY